MIWIQSFAFLVLAGLTQAQEEHSSHERSNNAKHEREVKRKYLILNSFPYHHYPLGLPNDDLYTSSIVSLSSGPLCSGVHISPHSVITAASCVYRESPRDLVVYSHSLKMGQPFEYLPVVKIHVNEDYDFETDLHNLAVLVVRNASHVPILRLPRLHGNIHDNLESSIFMAKYAYDPEKMEYSTLTHPVEVNLDISKCTDKVYGDETFFCVSRTDGLAYSYGLADLGTPLIFRNGHGEFLSGVFTGRHYNVHRTHYLYQNVHNNFAFLTSHARS